LDRAIGVKMVLQHSALEKRLNQSLLNGPMEINHDLPRVMVRVL